MTYQQAIKANEAFLDRLSRQERLHRPTIAVWFSCGVVSAVAAKIALDSYSDKYDVRVLNTPISEEDDDNRRFLRDCEEWLGVRVETVIASKYPTSSAVDVWDKRGAMSFPHGAPCTVHLKKEARQEWEAIHKPDWHVLGFSYDEASLFRRRASGREVEGLRRRAYCSSTTFGGCHGCQLVGLLRGLC